MDKRRKEGRKGMRTGNQLTTLRRIHIHKRRYQPRDTIHQTREKDPVNHPHVVLLVLPPQPHTAQNTNTARKRRDIQQRDVAHRLQRLFLQSVVAGFRVEVFVIELVEGRGEDDVAREENPCEEGGEDVVQLGDVVEAEEHVYIPSLGGCAAALEARAFGVLL